MTFDQLKILIFKKKSLQKPLIIMSFVLYVNNKKKNLICLVLKMTVVRSPTISNFLFLFVRQKS